MRRVMNLWPPFWGAGIRVLMISPDYRRAKVCLKHGLLNRNIVGVHFGGSLFAMTDPFFMLLFSQNLGPDYIIWDQAAKIEFLKPGKGKVHANFVITQDQINHLIAQASSGEKVLQDFVIEVKDMHSHTVARVTKTLYVRKKMK
jgi:acyl-coenzyme A thioesterase PaaI-like protein